ncbi:hypothetical protein I3842_03G003200 [Carya illinoinensis]|uniref:Uncharacterized protein n=1 Tax=Carya illinoinensis TaxID=32201 RepID=A0A922FB14_CARIL|nr:hypothetical protein I3842_03G003200 [Carya illinoinensis]
MSKKNKKERYQEELEERIVSLIASLFKHPQMRARIELLLKQQKLARKDVKDILQEFHDNIGDLDGREERASTRKDS